MNDQLYGFYTEEYEDGKTIETLMTGDGKAQFNSIHFDNGNVSIGFAYGRGQGLNTTERYPEGTLATDTGTKWQVKFEREESIDAMIRILFEIRSKFNDLKRL